MRHLRNRNRFVQANIYPYWKHRHLLIILVPVIAYFIVFHYAPMYGIIIAFKDYKIRKGVADSPWIGLEHFRTLINGLSFWKVFRNTFVISLNKLIFGFPAPIIFALLLNEVRKTRPKKLIQTISYLPHFLSWVVLAGIFVQFLSPSTGLINVLLKEMGLKPIYFLGDDRYFRFTLVITSIWKEIGWGTIIYLATISGVNPELYEAAAADGARRLTQVLHITIPSIMPVITIMFILAVGRILNDDFDQIFNLYNEAVYSTGDVLSTYTYRAGLIEMRYDFATAVGLFKNILGLTLLLVTNAITKRINGYAIW